MEHNGYYNNALARQIKLIPEYMGQINKNVSFIRLLDTITMKEIYDMKRIIITGCGDSYLAGIAMKPMMEEMTGLDIEICRAVDFSRYYPENRLGQRPNDPLVILISVSGNISRLIEAAKRAKKLGANTLAVTDSEETALAKECNDVLELCVPETERAPGLGAYIATCFALFALCIRIGRVNYAFEPPAEDVFRPGVMSYIQSFSPEVCDKIASEIYPLAKKWKDSKSIDFVGDSGSFASAQFAAWKCIECYGGSAGCEDSENWLHTNYLMGEPESRPAVVFAQKKSPSFGRLVETVAEMCQIRRNVLVITDANKESFCEKAIVCNIPEASDYRYAPLMEHVPAVFLASYIGELLGKHYFREGDGDNWEQPTGVYPIRRSEIVIL